MRPVLLDTSVYIAALRGHDRGILDGRRGPDSPLWLSSVVLEELYAGIRSADSGALEKMERDFEKAKRLLVPNLSDWTQTGRILARVGEECGYERSGRARLTNDALIAMSAARSGITIITLNGRDFTMLARFRPFDWQLERQVR